MDNEDPRDRSPSPPIPVPGSAPNPMLDAFKHPPRSPTLFPHSPWTSGNLSPPPPTTSSGTPGSGGMSGLSPPSPTLASGMVGSMPALSLSMSALPHSARGAGAEDDSAAALRKRKSNIERAADAQLRFKDMWLNP